MNKACSELSDSKGIGRPHLVISLLTAFVLSSCSQGNDADRIQVFDIPEHFDLMAFEGINWRTTELVCEAEHTAIMSFPELDELKPVRTLKVFLGPSFDPEMFASPYLNTSLGGRLRAAGVRPILVDEPDEADLLISSNPLRSESSGHAVELYRGTGCTLTVLNSKGRWVASGVVEGDADSELAICVVGGAITMIGMAGYRELFGWSVANYDGASSSEELQRLDTAITYSDGHVGLFAPPPVNCFLSLLAFANVEFESVAEMRGVFTQAIECIEGQEGAACVNNISVQR